MSLFNISFRERLITVPSCDEHNMRKSNLDEYLMVTLSGKVGNNSLAYVQTQTKIDRSVKRNSKLFDIEEREVLKIKDKELPVLWINVDNHKVNHSFESIARGLYYHEYNKSYKGKLTIISKIFSHPGIPSKKIYSQKPNRHPNPLYGGLIERLMRSFFLHIKLD